MKYEDKSKSQLIKELKRLRQQVDKQDDLKSKLEAAENTMTGLSGLMTDAKYKQAEQLLKESEEKYRKLFENVKNATMVFDAETLIFEDVNEATLKLYGYTRSEFLRLTPIDISAEKEKTKASIQRVISGAPKSRHVPLRSFVKKDGTIFHGEISTGKYYSEGHLKIFGVVKDITKRKEAEEEKMIYLNYLKSMNQIADVLQKTMDIDETLRGVLQKLLSIFDCDRAWLLYPCDPDASTYRVPYECTRPTYPGAFSLNEDQPITPAGKAVMNMMLANTDPVTFKFDKIDEVDSEEARDFVVKFNIQSQMLINLNPRVGKPWIMGLHQCSYQRGWSKEEKRLFKDISIRIEAALTNKLLYQDLQQSEEKLRQSESKYKTLLDNLQQKIFLKDKKSVYVSCNENYARDLKIKTDEIIGRTDYDFYPRDLANKYRADDARIMRSDIPEALEEKYIQDGREIFVQTVKTPVKDDEGNVFGVLGIFWDITERKRAEKEIEQKSQELEALTQDLRRMSTQLSKKDELSRRKFARILHEQVGQNLSAMKIVYNEVMKEYATDKPEMKEAISQVLATIEDTISSTRELTSELYPVILDRLGFIPAIHWYSDLILKPKKIMVETDINGLVERLPSEDKLSLFRIVQEAFHNIDKHASATKINIELKRVRSSLQLIIKDNGIGCDLEKVEKKKDKGIGLMLIKERALSLGGDFKVERISNKGTKLLIKIPIKKQ